MRKLEAKGVVTHDVEERTSVFRLVYQRADITDSATRELLTRVFQGWFGSHWLTGRHLP